MVVYLVIAVVALVSLIGWTVWRARQPPRTDVCADCGGLLCGDSYAVDIKGVRRCLICDKLQEMRIARTISTIPRKEH